MLVNEPAFEHLRRSQDVVGHGKRRFRVADLRASARSAGFEIRRSGYFNTALYVPALVSKWLDRSSGQVAGASREISLPGPLLTTLIDAVMWCEQMFLRVATPPFGVTTFVVLRKPARPPSADGDASAADVHGTGSA